MMIRPVTLLGVILVLISGLYLYQVKHRAQVLRHGIDQSILAADASKQHIAALQAEWVRLNNPVRLEVLSKEFLNLQPIQTDQFVTLSHLAGLLPPPGAPLPPTAQPFLAPFALNGRDLDSPDALVLTAANLPLPPPSPNAGVNAWRIYLTAEFPPPPTPPAFVPPVAASSGGNAS